MRLPKRVFSSFFELLNASAPECTKIRIWLRKLIDNGTNKDQIISILLSHRAQPIFWPNYHQSKQSWEEKISFCKFEFWECKIRILSV